MNAVASRDHGDRCVREADGQVAVLYDQQPRLGDIFSGERLELVGAALDLAQESVLAVLSDVLAE